MPVRNFLTIAGSILALTLAATPASAADAGLVPLLLEKLGLARAFLEALLAAGYRRQPALVLALSALLAVPVLAAFSLLTLRLSRGLSRHRLRATRPTPAPRPVVRDPRPQSGVPAWPAQAWLQMEGNTFAVPIAADLVSIGRHEDNVVNIGDASVHRYHAIIHRSSDAHFIITDISGETGNGVRVNGELRQHARLVHGDRIELGRARLTFAAVPH
ncbi:MAG: FHA domain-containing protein [Hyphomicrobiaceae bacterium]|nr:FHA domain-containing protein [Hyphomicrobiaceae bacterium]